MGGGKVLRGQAGSVTIELILVLPLIVLTLVAVLQVVGMARARIELEAVAREGARVAATTPDPTRAVAAVRAALAPEVRDKARITVTRPDRVGVPAVVSIRMRQSFGPPLPSGLALDLTATATMRTER